MLFDASTVAALAARIESHVGDGGRAALVARERPEQVPLSLAQQRMWFLNRYDTASSVNNIPVAIRLSGELDVAALQVAIIDVIDRHESLRTVFPETGSAPVQVVLDAAQIVPDLTPVPVTETNIVQHLIELASMAFDVTSEVPLHARLFELSETEYVLGMVVHHISARRLVDGAAGPRRDGRLRRAHQLGAPGLGAAAGPVRRLRAVAA